MRGTKPRDLLLSFSLCCLVPSGLSRAIAKVHTSNPLHPLTQDVNLIATMKIARSLDESRVLFEN